MTNKFSFRFDSKEWSASEALHHAELELGMELCMAPEEFRTADMGYKVELYFLSKRIFEVVISIDLLDVDDLDF